MTEAHEEDDHLHDHKNFDAMILCLVLFVIVLGLALSIIKGLPTAAATGR